MIGGFFKRVPLAAVLILIASCSQSGETTAVCSRAPELESSIVAVDAAVVSMSEVSARQLQSMFAVLLSSLVSIGEVAPPDVVDQFVQVERAYLTRNDNVEALSAVRSFIADSCRVDLGGGINRAPSEELNLPSPSIDVEPQPDINADFYNEESALRSYAYFVAERLGQVLTPEQALCIGTMLTDNALEQGALSDAQFDTLVNESFTVCKVDRIVATTIVD